MFLYTLLCILLVSFRGIHLQESETDSTTLLVEPPDDVALSKENIDTGNEERCGEHKFLGQSHELSSGCVYIIQNDTIFIENFNYDGLSPDAHFLLGMDELIYDNGIVIPDENGSPKKLKAYRNVNVTLHTEENCYDYEWLGVWCSLDKELIGYVFLINMDVIKVEDSTPEKENEIDSTTFSTKSNELGLINENIESENEEPYIQQKFVGFTHELSSGHVHILKNDTIFIENFNYDGLSLDAHFSLGTGELKYDNGIIIPDENGTSKTLKAYHNVNVTLHTEENCYDYDWLGVWSISNKEMIGYVLLKANDRISAPIIINLEDSKPKKEIFQVTNVNYLGEESIKILPQFSNTSHRIKSGNIRILNETTIYIPNFYYDGKASDVNFWVGKGSEPSEDGREVHYLGYDHLPEFDNANILLFLPEEITVNDIEWLSVWDVMNRRSYGNVMIHSEMKQTYVQIPPLTADKSFHFSIHSGPIIIVDTRAIFITNLHYNGKAPDAHFWAGSGDKGLDENGHLLLDENNSTKPLSSYSGVDIYIILPEYVDIRKIDYIGIWSSSLKSGLGCSNITQDLSSIPEASGLYQYNEEGRYIARLPKCCPRNKVKTTKGCINRITSTSPMTVYEGNMSFFNDEPMENIIYEPYLHQPSCSYGMFRIDLSEEFYLLTDGVLILPDGGTITKDRYCYDVSEIQIDEVWSWNETIFMCFEGDHAPAFLNPLIVSCIYISSFFLLVTSIIFIAIKEARAERGTNVMGYTIMMSLSFGCLATARILHVDGSACTILGFIYQYFLVSSFTWLLCLTGDIFYQVWKYEKNYNNIRYLWFAGLAICLPIVAVIISIFVNNKGPSNPTKPTFGYEPCWLRSDKKVFFYYLPIGLSIVLNYILITLTWIKIKKLQLIPNWPIRAKGIKNVFRSCYLILGIMTICWAAEILSYYFETNNGLWIAIDLIDSLQGVFVFLVFVTHDPVYQILKVRFSKSRPKSDTVDLYDVPARPPSEHGMLLSKLQHAESVEDLCCFADDKD